MRNALGNPSLPLNSRSTVYPASRHFFNALARLGTLRPKWLRAVVSVPPEGFAARKAIIMFGILTTVKVPFVEMTPPNWSTQS